MKKLVTSIRIALLLAALALTGSALFPRQAAAWKSCEYYCGAAGPYYCNWSPPALGCTTLWQD